MPDMELVNYIRSARDCGVPEDEIVNNLVKSGWAPKKIDKIRALMDFD